MDVCILHQAGDILVHQHMKTSPDALLKTIAPYRDAIVLAVACLFTWYWLADLCAQAGMPFVLGHALYMKAMHGGKATNDTIDAHKIAILLRGGMLPQAYVSPAEMRATRDLLRRRMYLTRTRAELLTHIQHTKSQDNVPEIGKKLASKANRAGVAARFPEPAVQKRMEVALALIGYDDPLLNDMELHMVRAAKQHDAQTLSLLQTVPGIGTILSLVLRYEMHDITRFPRVQDLIFYCRLIKCAKQSAGKRDGTSGTKLGHAYLQWAFSETAVLLLRENPPGQQSLTRLEKTHGQGQALTVLAPKLARAVYSMFKRQTAFDMQKFLQSEERGAREPVASLDTHGPSLHSHTWYCSFSCVHERQAVHRSCALSSVPLLGRALRLCDLYLRR
jgi:transposase